MTLLRNSAKIRLSGYGFQMYSIGQLQAETGATRRTIHFYVQQAILPPPSGAGPRAAYDEIHRLRLLAVPKLKAAGWRLDQIRTFFQRAALSTIARVVETGRPPADEEWWLAAKAGSNVPGAEGEEIVRYRLAPGVELLVSTSASDGARATAERSIPLIAQLFKGPS